MPMPSGWFQVAWSDEIEIAKSVRMYYFDRHLVGWRDADGVAHVWDAFCPHLGAHLAVRSEIEGCTIRCALHGWTFDAAGSCVDVPYSDRPNRKATVRTYPVVERNGAVFAWYHPEGQEPSWSIPELPEFGPDSGYSSTFTRQYRLGCHWQEIAETQVDAAHIQAHLLEYQAAMNGGSRPSDAPVPRFESYECEGASARIRIRQGFPTPWGEVDGRIDTDMYGPGFAATWFTGLVDTLLLGCATPVTPGSCELRYSFVVADTGDESSTRGLGEAFIREIHERTAEDVEIWENKAYVPRPALAKGDGPILAFRRWCEQFYAEGVDRNPEPWAPPPPEAPVGSGCNLPA
jgi:phenylpropionate dioxygenase-like ring-hydroxylating dioxygenase large terminal subunit